jgi:drug/metabolite transporter (DMT)-like permease
MSEPPTERRSFAPHLLLLSMIVIWACSYTAVKIGLTRLAPFAVVATRFWVAVPCLLPLALRRGGQPLLASVVPGVITGLALLTGYLLQTIGMQETTASMGGFLSGLIVLLVAVGGWLILRDPLRLGAVLGLGLGIGGVVLLCLRSDAAAEIANTPRGIWLQVGSSCSYAAHILLLSRLSPRGGEMQYTFWQLLTVALGATIAMVVRGEFAAAGKPLLLDAAMLGSVAYLGFLATALGIGVQSLVQPRIRPTHVALLFATQPLFAAIAGWAVLGDVMGWQQLAGGALIVGGIVAVSLAR